MALIANPYVAESTLIDVASELVPSVEVAGMNTCQPVDYDRNRVVFVGAMTAQVPMVGHQAIRDDTHRNPAPCALHKSLKMQVVVRSAEQRLSVHSAVEDVIDIPGFSVSSCSRHAKSSGNLWASVQGPGPVKTDLQP